MKKLKNMTLLLALTIVLTAGVASPKTFNSFQNHTTTWEPTPTPMPTTTLKTWVSCLYAGAQPGTINNYMFIPVASYIPSGCGSDNDVGANTNVEYALKSGFSADAIWNGTNVAPSSKEEMALFVTNNIISWNGQEYGFVETNNDNTLKGYVQDGQKNYYAYVVLGKTDGLKHNYKVTVTKNNNIYTFNWYIDGVIKGTLKYMNPTQDYANLKYALVGTTHKTVNWNSEGIYLKFTNILYL